MLVEVLLCWQVQSHSILQVGFVYFVFTQFNFGQFNSSLIGSAAFWCPVLVSFLPSTLSSSLLFFLLFFFPSLFSSFLVFIFGSKMKMRKSQKWRVLQRLFFNFTHFLTERILYQCLNFQLNYTFISKQKSTELHNHLQYTYSTVFLAVVSITLTHLFTCCFLILLHITFMQENS